MSVNFKDLLSTKLDDVKAPSALPEGTYHGTISSFEYGDNNKNKTPYAVSYTHLTLPTNREV